MSIDRLEIEAKLAFPGFTLDIAEVFELAGCTALFGASGAGKTSLLRLIAGFLRPSSGRITHRGATWCDTKSGVFLDAHERPVGVVFQDGRLFPHLTVEQNLHFADRRAVPGRRGDMGDVIESFDLPALLPRRPDKLSGGERQRVALARTLLTRPSLLLLDEPLSALDRERKAEILPYLDDLAGRFAVPTLYVSHNVDEVVRIAERTVIINAGRIEAAGPTAAVINAYGLENEIAVASVLNGVVTGHDEKYNLTKVAIGDGAIFLPINQHKAIDASVNIKVDARNVAVATALSKDISIRNVLPATIETLSPDEGSPFVDVVLRVSGERLRAQVTRAACDDLALAPGQAVYALVKTASFAV